MGSTVTRTVLILQLLLSLLSSSWVQAASVRMDMPVESVAVALVDESLPPCHRAALIEDLSVELANKMPCCTDAGECQCDGLCQQVSFPSVGLDGLSYQSGFIQKTFSRNDWIALSPVSLFRPPIHKA